MKKETYAWVIAFTIMLVLFLSHGFGRFAYPPILPAMREGLSLSYAETGFIGTGNFLGYLLMALTGGFVAARIGIRKAVFAGLMALGVGLFLTGFSWSFLSAFSMRFFTGLASAMAFVPAMALPAAWFDARRRGLATGIGAAGVGLGLSLMGVILPFCIEKFGTEGWRYTWWFLGIVAFGCSFICYLLLRDKPDDAEHAHAEREDKKRGLVQAASMNALLRTIVKERRIWKLGVVYLLFGFSHVIYITFIVAFLTKESALSETTAGAIFAVLGIASIFSGILWGSISDVLGRGLGAALSYATLFCSCIIPFFWKGDVFLYCSAILFGLTLSSIPPIIAAAAGDTLGPRLAPAGLGFLTIFFGTGQAIGPAVGGWIKDLTGTFTYAFLLSAAAALLGFFTSLTIKKSSRSLDPMQKS